MFYMPDINSIKFIKTLLFLNFKTPLHNQWIVKAMTEADVLPQFPTVTLRRGCFV